MKSNTVITVTLRSNTEIIFSPIVFTIFMAAFVGLLTYPEGISKNFAGKVSFFHFHHFL